MTEEIANHHFEIPSLTAEYPVFYFEYRGAQCRIELTTNKTTINRGNIRFHIATVATVEQGIFRYAVFNDMPYAYGPNISDIATYGIIYPKIKYAFTGKMAKIPFLRHLSKHLAWEETLAEYFKRAVRHLMHAVDVLHERNAEHEACFKNMQFVQKANLENKVDESPDIESDFLKYP